MAHTPDLRTDPPAEPAAAAAQSRLRAMLGDNPLLTVVLAVTVVLLLFMLNGHSLSLLIAVGTVAAVVLTVAGIIAVAQLLFILNDHSNRLDRLETTVANGFAAQDPKIDELDRKLAALNRTDQVDSALEGRLLDSESAVAGSGGAPD